MTATGNDTGRLPATRRQATTGLPATRRQATTGLLATRRQAIAAGLALGVAACTPFGRDDGKLFNLRAAPRGAAGPRLDRQLLVELPVAAAGLDSTRIARRDRPTDLDYFAGAAWIERTPLLVQGLIVESFENSGRIVAVGRDSGGLRADFLLKTELRDFQAEYAAGSTAGAAPQAHIRLTAKLVNMSRRAIEAGETFDARITAAGAGIDPIIAAFDSALGQVLTNLVAWTLDQAAQVKPGAGLP